MAGDHPVDQQVWLREVLDLLPFPALMIEPGTARILFVNRSAGLTPLGVSFDGQGRGDGSHATDSEGRCIPPELLPHRRVAHGERFDGEQFTWHTPQGEATFVAFSGTLPDVSGQPALALMTLLDVTRQKGTEAELREAIRARDELFSFAGHELKEPLGAMLLSIEVLDRTAARHGVVPPQVLGERLGVIKRQGGRLARMIENLLDVSRIANGRLQLDVQALDLRDLVLEVVGRFREQAREAGVDLGVEPSGPIIGYFDRIQLEHAVGNLVSNALKYGAGRPITIRLGCDDEAATLEVEDRGIGIAEADRGRVFGRFERATESHREKSLGLGLYIVRSIVEAHGGAIGLRSEPGQGSTFTVTLPRKRMPAADPSTRDPTGNGPEHRGERVH